MARARGQSIMIEHVKTLSDELGQTYFNANKMRPEQVARVFVQSSHLEALTSQDNVVLVGPRGSGKTTLMKMLTRSALDSWGGELGARLLSVPALPIYVGSDTVLRAQLQVPEDQLPSGQALTAFASARRAKLGLHLVQTALLAVEHELSQGRASIETAAEADLCRRVCQIFRISPAFYSLEALGDAVTDALLELSSAIQRAADGDAAPVKAVSASIQSPALADVLTQCQAAFASSVTGLPEKWLLLFDEIEYLHDASRSEILQLIRSLGPSFGLKIALTPLSITDDYLSEVEKSFLHAGHAFLPVTLVFEDTKSMLDFSETLSENILQRLMPGFESLPRALGVSVFADPRTRAKVPNRFQTTERLPDKDIVATLASAQPRFHKYAEESGLLGEELDRLSPAQRAARFRKALPIMLMWLERLRPSVETEVDSAIGRRGRKVHQVYTGYPTFLLLADGNPRVLMGMLNRLLKSLRDEAGGGPGGPGPTLRHEWQDSAIESARREQLALANAYLSKHGRVLGDLFAIDVLHHIGLSFEHSVHLGPSFSPDPATTFTVDSALPANLAHAVIDAYYTGVLVALDPIVDRSDIRPGSELLGNRFRLSFLQGSHYWLPARKGRQVNLSAILRDVQGSPSREAVQHEQGSIF